MEQPPSPPDDVLQRARAVAQAVLAEPEFQHPKSWFETWLLPRLVRWFEALSGLGPVLRYTLLVAILLLVVLIVAWVARALVRISRRGRDEPSPVVAAARPPPARLTPDALRRAADDAARSGSFAESIRLSWMAVVTALDGAVTAGSRSARADFEYVAEARRAGAPASAVADLAREFQGVRFGGAPADAGGAERCLALVDRIRGWASGRAGEAPHG